MTTESSALMHRVLLYTILQLQVQDNPPSLFGLASLRTHLIRLVRPTAVAQLFFLLPFLLLFLLKPIQQPQMPPAQFPTPILLYVRCE
ncbi:unnamed protein product [Protopolystoma xenopodis]|uniref:Uncharacterized protein n=1 Tax=Protopolystoma xenopodis TaxID=117903 RepID=A0A448X1R8_9PLAT|nr:unnamed protein product [Protopolystoma xenopodis]